MTTPPSRSSARLHVVDAVRGAAVVFMLAWHTADSWLDATARAGTGFWVAEIVGGLAAPLFFLLAGVALGLSERRPATGAGVRAACRRGLGIVVAGYGLRTWAWGVDHSAVVSPARAHLVLLLALGLGLMYAGLGERPSALRARGAMGLAGVALAGLVAALLEPHDAGVALRLDVLQGIGVALVVVVLLLGATSRAPTIVRVLLPALAALGIALFAPHVLGVPPPPGPLRVWDYVARFDVAPLASGARFPLVPWLGYALLGAALGRALAGRAPIGGAFGVPTALPAYAIFGGAALAAALAFEAGPVASSVLPHAGWLRGVARLTFYTSIAITIAAAVATFAPRGGRSADALALLGRHSLVIYAVHLEIAYGLPGSVIMRSLGWGTWGLAASLLLLSMGALALGIERREARSPRDHERSSSHAAPRG